MMECRFGVYNMLLPIACGRLVVFSGHSGFLYQKPDCHDIPEILMKMVFNTLISFPYYLIHAEGKVKNNKTIVLT
jgi:hypothetical protein